MWNITAVDDYRNKQFSKEKGDQMAALPATVGGLSVDVPVGTDRRALAIAELSGSDTVSITIGLEWLVDLTQTVAGLVGQQLDEGCFVGTPYEPSRRRTRPTGRWSRGRRYIFCRYRFLLQNAGPQTTGRISGLMGSGVPTTREHLHVHQKRSLFGEQLLRRHFLTAEVRRVTLKRSSVSLGNRGSKKRKTGSMNANYALHVRSFPLQ